ncbi:transglycosylase [Lactobacillus phage Bacchae]|uniref:Putative hydrolase n=1 Tax=Lactobacillus phage Bacchae TaxID=2079429 RepID=A0A2K9VCL2_9CAUD|nr:transglycosylase [Lactobacillus phage Bacchae]AUV59935.1 putative hydrolase [Lactobacillus phage Bacchae]
MSQPVQSSSSSASQSTQSSQSSVQPAKSASSTPKSSYTGSSVNTSNGTLADSEKQAVLSQMQSRTGVPASTWDAIITRESNWQVDAANPSSTARGLFQQLYGGTGSVQSQIDNAVKLYHNAGDSMSPWALTNY